MMRRTGILGLILVGLLTAEAEATVLRLRARTGNVAWSRGTAFTIGERNQRIVILTAGHLLQHDQTGRREAEVQVAVGKRWLAADVHFWQMTPTSDAALLSIPAADWTDDYPHERLQATPSRGEELFSTGYSGRDQQRIVARERSYRVEDLEHDWIYCAGESQPGDSGAPAYDEQGITVGIVCGNTGYIDPVQRRMRMRCRIMGISELIPLLETDCQWCQPGGICPAPWPVAPSDPPPVRLVPGRPQLYLEDPTAQQWRADIEQRLAALEARPAPAGPKGDRGPKGEPGPPGDAGKLDGQLQKLQARLNKKFEIIVIDEGGTVVSRSKKPLAIGDDIVLIRPGVKVK